jgi:hypothetical protein
MVLVVVVRQLAVVVVVVATMVGLGPFSITLLEEVVELLAVVVAE